MSTAVYILAGLIIFLGGFIVGVLVSAWYYFHVIKEVNEEQAGKRSKDDDDVKFDCESV
jgi:uncharacterized membrane protein YciS (DUF1049 family)